MDSKPKNMTLGHFCEFTRESVSGRLVIRTTCVHPVTGLRVTLTFPVEAASDLERFKERLVRIAIDKLDGRQGTA